MVTKKNNGRNTTTGNRRESNSFALFGDDIVAHTNNNIIDLFSKVVKKTKESNVIEQVGSQHADEKPKSPECSIKEVGHQAKRGFRSLKVNQNNTCTESPAVNAERQDNTKIDGGSESSGSKPGKFKTNDNGSVHQTGRNKRKIQESKRRTGIRKNNDPDTETLDFCKYPVSEFEVTDKIQNYSLQAKPRVIDDFTSEIIIEGRRYKVSSWSIKNGQYIQGLDSRFLVIKYKVNKHR